jgi:alpha-galactosidase
MAGITRRDLLLALPTLLGGWLSRGTFAHSTPAPWRIPQLIGGVDVPRKGSRLWEFVRRDYADFNAVEWQVRLRGVPDEPGLVLDLNSADLLVRFPAASGVSVHWSKGSHDEPSDFQPREDVLHIGQAFSAHSFGGRSSDGAMPYFNLAAKGGGLVFAIGWTGDWKIALESLGDGTVRIRAGLKHSSVRLLPGEEVRLPSVLAMGYSGEWLDGQNQFRQLMLRAFSPASHPPLELMAVAASIHGMVPFNETTEEKFVAFVDDVAATHLPLDTLWLDAGWNVGGFPAGQGNLDTDPARFPRRLAPLGDAARRTRKRFLVWFEPERAMTGSWLDRTHPSWLLHPSGTPNELRYQEQYGFRLLDLGNPEARRWALDAVSAHIREAGISIYRHDCNLYPAYFWQTGADPQRAAMREIRYISGLYQFFEELAGRHPGLIIDNCASGGRRLDFEMMRRAVPLLRSDSDWNHATFPRNAQAMTHGLSLWLPLHGLGAVTTDDTALRSGMGACGAFAIKFRNGEEVATLRRHLARYLKVRHLFTADYYPLTPWSLDPAQWLAFQFHDPSSGEGLVQAFCARATERPGLRLKLRGLEPDRRYAVADWDDPGDPVAVPGKELLEQGLQVFARRDKEAAVFQYSALA